MNDTLDTLNTNLSDLKTEDNVVGHDSVSIDSTGTSSLLNKETLSSAFNTVDSVGKIINGILYLYVHTRSKRDANKNQKSRQGLRKYINSTNLQKVDTQLQKSLRYGQYINQGIQVMNQMKVKTK